MDSVLPQANVTFVTLGRRERTACGPVRQLKVVLSASAYASSPPVGAARAGDQAIDRPGVDQKLLTEAVSAARDGPQPNVMYVRPVGSSDDSLGRADEQFDRRWQEGDRVAAAVDMQEHAHARPRDVHPVRRTRE